jgi:hypothetical protein
MGNVDHCLHLQCKMCRVGKFLCMYRFVFRKTHARKSEGSFLTQLSRSTVPNGPDGAPTPTLSLFISREVHICTYINLPTLHTSNLKMEAACTSGTCPTSSTFTGCKHPKTKLASKVHFRQSLKSLNTLVLARPNRKRDFTFCFVWE